MDVSLFEERFVDKMNSLCQWCKYTFSIRVGGGGWRLTGEKSSIGGKFSHEQFLF